MMSETGENDTEDDGGDVESTYRALMEQRQVRLRRYQSSDNYQETTSTAAAAGIAAGIAVCNTSSGIAASASASAAAIVEEEETSIATTGDDDDDDDVEATYRSLMEQRQARLRNYSSVSGSSSGGTQMQLEQQQQDDDDDENDETADVVLHQQQMQQMQEETVTAAVPMMMDGNMIFDYDEDEESIVEHNIDIQEEDHPNQPPTTELEQQLQQQSIVFQDDVDAMYNDLLQQRSLRLKEYYDETNQKQQKQPPLQLTSSVILRNTAAVMAAAHHHHPISSNHSGSRGSKKSFKSCCNNSNSSSRLSIFSAPRAPGEDSSDLDDTPNTTTTRIYSLLHLQQQQGDEVARTTVEAAAAKLFWTDHKQEISPVYVNHDNDTDDLEQQQQGERTVKALGMSLSTSSIPEVASLREGLDFSPNDDDDNNNISNRNNNDNNIEMLEDIVHDPTTDGHLCLLTTQGASDSKYPEYNGMLVDPLQNDRATEIMLLSFQRPHMRTFHMAWISFFVAFFVWFSITPLLSEVQNSIGVTRRQLWTSSVLAVASSAITRIVIGPLNDKYGARWTMSTTLVLAAIPTLFSGLLIRSALSLYMTRFVIGIAGSTFVTCEFWASCTFTKEIAGTANALVAGWGNLGGGIAQLVMGSFLFPVVKMIYAKILSDDDDEDNNNNEMEDPWLDSTFNETTTTTDTAATAAAANHSNNNNTITSDQQQQHSVGINPFRDVGEDNSDAADAAETTFTFSRTSDLSWRTIMVFPAIVSFIVAWIIVRYTDDTPKGNVVKRRCNGLAEPVRFWDNLYNGMNSYNTWILSLQYGCCFGVEITMTQAASLYFKSEFGLSTESAAAIASIFGWMNLFARGIGGFVSDMANARAGMKGRLWVQVSCLVMEGCMVIAFAFCSSLAAAIAVMIIFSTFVQAAEGSTFGIVPYVNPKVTGTISGIVGAGGNVGGVGFALLFREMPDRAAFVWMGLIVIVCAAWTMFVTIPGHRSLFWGHDAEEIIEMRRKAKLPEVICFQINAAAAEETTNETATANTEPQATRKEEEEVNDVDDEEEDDCNNSRPLPLPSECNE